MMWSARFWFLLELAQTSFGALLFNEAGVASTCAPLANKGSHFTVDIQVGTPGQTFSVVADTGSDAVIVPSCICKESGSCSKDDRCFRGTNKSSTFKMPGLNGTVIGPKT